jgi:hypothetical protein
MARVSAGNQCSDRRVQSLRLPAADRGFESGLTRVEHLIDCMIDDFATSTREIASTRKVELMLMSSV